MEFAHSSSDTSLLLGRKRLPSPRAGTELTLSQRSRAQKDVTYFEVCSILRNRARFRQKKVPFHQESTARGSTRTRLLTRLRRTSCRACQLPRLRAPSRRQRDTSRAQHRTRLDSCICGIHFGRTSRQNFAKTRQTRANQENGDQRRLERLSVRTTPEAQKSGVYNNCTWRRSSSMGNKGSSHSSTLSRGQGATSDIRDALASLPGSAPTNKTGR